MKLKKRKIKYSAIFFICWFALLVILVDGILKFQTVVDFFGSYAWTETALLLLVIIPTLIVYKVLQEFVWVIFYGKYWAHIKATYVCASEIRGTYLTDKRHLSHRNVPLISQKGATVFTERRQTGS